MASQAERSDAVAAQCPLSRKDRPEVREDRERRTREISGERKGGEEERCLNEGTEASRGQEGRLNKCGNAGTRGSGGHLSPTGKLRSVVPEVPRSSP